MNRLKILFFILSTSMLVVVIGCKNNELESKDIEKGNKVAVKSILNAQSKEVELSKEDKKVIKDILEEGTWDNTATSECINNCCIFINNDLLYYHSECGTFNDKQKNRNLSVDSKTRDIINKILEKYITLDVVETPR